MASASQTLDIQSLKTYDFRGIHGDDEAQFDNHPIAGPREILAIKGPSIFSSLP